MAWVVKTTGTYDVKLGRFRKPGAFYRRGVSDILGIFQGKPLAIELKSKKGKPTIEQVQFLEEFKANGGIAFIARSVDDVERELYGHG